MEYQNLFRSLSSQIGDQNILRQIEEAQNIFENALDDENLDEEFNSIWDDIENSYLKLNQNKMFSKSKLKLHPALQNIKLVLKKLSANSAIPNENYKENLTNFQTEFKTLQKNLGSDIFLMKFVEDAEDFIENFNNTYSPSFLTAKLDSRTINHFIATIEQSLNEYLQIMKDINENCPIPSAFNEIRQLLNGSHQSDSNGKIKRKQKNNERSNSQYKNNKNSRGSRYKEVQEIKKRSSSENDLIEEEDINEISSLRNNFHNNSYPRNNNYNEADLLEDNQKNFKKNSQRKSDVNISSNEIDFSNDDNQEYILKGKSKFIQLDQNDDKNRSSNKIKNDDNIEKNTSIKRKNKKKETNYINYDESESDKQSNNNDDHLINYNFENSKNKKNRYNNDESDDLKINKKNLKKREQDSDIESDTNNQHNIYDDNENNYNNDINPQNNRSQKKRKSITQKASDKLPNSSEFADNLSPGSSSNYDSYEQDDITFTERHRNIQRYLEDFSSQLSDISEALYNCADKNNNTKEIRSEAKKLSQLAEQDLFQEFSNETKKLNREIKHSKQMMDLISKSQADRTKISNEVLQKLSKEDLIFLLHNFFANNTDVKVPIELTIPKGTPSEFKELASKYKTASKYNEQASSEIQRMNIAIIQLRSENQRLKCQAASMAMEASLHNELDEINERLRQLNKITEKNAKPEKYNKYDVTSTFGSNINYHYENLSQKELTAETQKQNQRKTETENELKKCDKFDLHMQIEMLKSENAEYQRVLLEKQKENEELQNGIKDLSKRIAKNESQEAAKIAQQQQQQKLQQQQMLQQQQQKIMQQQQQQINQEETRKSTQSKASRKSNLSMSARKKSPTRQVISSYSQKNFPKINSSVRKESPTNRPPFYNYNNSNKI